MAKFSGNIGYCITEETEPGIFEETIKVFRYTGDIIKNTRRLQEAGKVNDNVTVNNRISIIADPFANNNFHSMRYVEMMGTKWKVVEVEVEYPRLILSVGGVYNG